MAKQSRAGLPLPDGRSAARTGVPAANVVPEPPVALRLILPESSVAEVCCDPPRRMSGATGVGRTVTATLAHVELPQEAVPSGRNKSYWRLVKRSTRGFRCRSMSRCTCRRTVRSVVPEPPVAVRLMLPESSAQKLLRSTDAPGRSHWIQVEDAEAAIRRWSSHRRLGPESRRPWEWQSCRHSRKPRWRRSCWPDTPGTSRSSRPGRRRSSSR